jgi:hypothetical protein
LILWSWKIMRCTICWAHRIFNTNSSYASACKSSGHIVYGLVLDFILSHFEEPIWPRAIFTKTLGKQYTVYNREEALARFKQSNLLDCRINAYPDYTEFKGINRQPPNFIFIGIDMCLFTTDKEFWSAVEETGKPWEADVLWSGNGIHICQPVQAIF